RGGDANGEGQDGSDGAASPAAQRAQRNEQLRSHGFFSSRDPGFASEGSSPALNMPVGFAPYFARRLAAELDMSTMTSEVRRRVIAKRASPLAVLPAEWLLGLIDEVQVA